MATQKQIKDFINKIGPCAVVGFNTLGKVLPSVCIGMACVESGFGTAGSCKHNSFLGQKVGSGRTALKYWDGTFFKSKTAEEYTVGVYTNIVDAFRSYKSMQQCVLNYYELLNTNLYKRVLAGVGYKTQMSQIKTSGYMTSSKEVNSVIKIIEKYNLTLWDIKGNSTSETLELSTPVNGNPYNEPTKTVKLNTRGNDARWLQFELNRKGYKLIVDGIAGPKTIAALEHFQESCGDLVVDGKCGPLTRAKLKGGENV